MYVIFVNILKVSTTSFPRRRLEMRAMTANFRNAVKDIKLTNLIIEIVDSSLLIGSIELITPQQTEELSLIASNFSTIK